MFAAAALVACGGGGGGGDAPPVDNGVGNGGGATKVAISGKAVDGPLQGATACYDLNDNGSCDSGEPTSAATGADGSYSFQVDTAAAGKHRVIVMVPATAIDADTGAAVGTAFTLQSPATGTGGAQSVFVSPLTTLVQSLIDSGVAPSTAADTVKAQAGLAVSPLADFTATGNADNQKAATLARLVQLTTLKLIKDLESTVGKTDISGGTVSAADVSGAITKAVTGVISSLSGAAGDPALSGLTGGALQAALTTAANTAATQSGLNANNATTLIGAAKLPPDPGAAPAESASLVALRYTDANNWYVRTFEASAADNTPHADGKLRYVDVRKQSASNGYSANGVVQAWGFSNDPTRAGDLHWNGSAWVGCALGTRSISSVRDAQGASTYDYCEGFDVGSSTRASVDISGQTLQTVFATKIRTFPGSAGGVPYSQWGPADLTRFGAATFPAGAKLYYQTSTSTAAAFAYDVQPASVATAFSPEAAAGGDVRTNPAVACAGTGAAAPVATPVTSLEDLVARNPGKPCVSAGFAVGSDTSLDPHERWALSTLSMGVVQDPSARPAGTGNFYDPQYRLRVSFDAATPATSYWRCLSRNNAGVLNCVKVGSGSYAIQTLADGSRVMTFSGLPALVQSTGFQRVFVERGGQVFFGYKNLVGQVVNFVRMNLEAANAVMRSLGLPVVRPTTQYADTSADTKSALATLKGVWGFVTDTDALVFRFGDEGRYLMGNASSENPVTREQSGGELGVFNYDAATKKFGALIETDFNMTAGLSNPGVDEMNNTIAITPTDLTVTGADAGRTNSFQRLSEDPTGIVGLWAGSLTNLRTPHFAFFPNGKVLMIDPVGDTSTGACNTANAGPPGSEFASYSFDAATGALRIFGKIYDTNGCAGFFDSSAGAVANTEANFTVTIASDGKSLSLPTDGAGTVTLFRISAKP